MFMRLKESIFLGQAPGSTFGKVLTNQAYNFANGAWTIGEAVPTSVRF